MIAPSLTGQHQPIIDRDLWDQVQARLAENRNERRDGRMSKQPSLLAGLTFDAHGHRMTPSHAVKKGKRYRYYVSQPLITGSRADAPEGCRIPAGEIERLVSERVCQALTDHAFMLQTIDADSANPTQAKKVLGLGERMAKGWSDLSTAEQRRLLLMFVIRIDLRADQVNISMRPERLFGALLGEGDTPCSVLETSEQSDVVTLSVAAQLTRSGMETMMVINGQRGKRQHQKPDRSMIKLLVQATDYRDRVIHSRGMSIRQMAAEAGVSRSYFTRILRLTYLAPDIVRAILSGSHPPERTAAKLKAASRLPMAWPQQVEVLGFF